MEDTRRSLKRHYASKEKIPWDKEKYPLIDPLTRKNAELAALKKMLEVTPSQRSAMKPPEATPRPMRKSQRKRKH